MIHRLSTLDRVTEMEPLRDCSDRREPQVDLDRIIECDVCGRKISRRYIEQHRMYHAGEF